MLFEQEPETRGAQCSAKPVIVETVGGSLRRFREIDRAGRERDDCDDRQQRKKIELARDALADPADDIFLERMKRVAHAATSFSARPAGWRRSRTAWPASDCRASRG